MEGLKAELSDTLGKEVQRIDFFTSGQIEDIYKVQTDKWMFILIAMLVIFILGFFIDFIEIAFVVVPILVPIMASFGIDPVWFAILIAMNLQASFLTPAFGFALFSLKGAAGDKVSTGAIYKGVIPFIGLQFVALLIIIFYPDMIY